MVRGFAAILSLLMLAACAHAPVPEFLTKRFEPFNRADTIAVALREWRLFGQPIEDATAADGVKAERSPGLWQRVGEYWWIGQKPDGETKGWTGKHDGRGQVFPPQDDAQFAWSAAFISYVMRISGAGDRFPYAPDHAHYVNAAARGQSPILRARSPDDYAPLPGDLICFGRGYARALVFADLPTGSSWPGHCAVAVGREAGTLDVIGGNVEDAVTMTSVPVGPDGRLVGPDHRALDLKHGWFVVLQVLYDAETEPAADR